MKRQRVAVVGCGMLAQSVHLPNVQANPRGELVAVCDLDPAIAEACRQTFGAARAETDWQRIVAADDIDVCILATHTNLRGAFIIPALEHGKAVYTEKPLAPDRAEMLAIVQAVRRTGRPVCVGHNRRSSPAMLEFRRLLTAAQGTTGWPASVDRSAGRESLPEERGLQLLMRVNDDIRSWKEWIFTDDAGIMFAEMVHFLDLALWLNPGHPVRVFADGSPRGNFTLLLRFDDGALTTIQQTMVGHFDYPKELYEAATHNITIAMDHHIEVRQCGLADEPLLQTFPYAAVTTWAPEPGMTGYFHALDADLRHAARTIGVEKGHARHLDRFLTHLDGLGENPCPVDGAVAVNRIALKCLESARLGLPVAITPEDWHIPA